MFVIGMDLLETMFANDDIVFFISLVHLHFWLIVILK